MTRVKRLIDDTLHTGVFSYLVGEARTGVPYPVLEDVLDGRYKECVASAPTEGSAGLFHRIHEPTRAMRTLATDIFPAYAGLPDRHVTRPAAIWRLVGRVHRQVFSGARDAGDQIRALLPDLARHLSGQAGEPVSPLSLAVAAEAYVQTGLLHLHDDLAAGVIPASLLVMAGLPREYVACFGVYYQDPVVYRAPGTRWVEGFYVPAPAHVLFGVYLDQRWVPVDFTRQPRPDETLPPQPTPYLPDPDFGPRADDGAPQVADYAHPYAMVFPPPPPGQRAVSPLLKHIPLLQG